MRAREAVNQEHGLHVAIIMDGNGRWAQQRNWPREAGHRAGADAVRRVVEAAPRLGVRVLIDIPRFLPARQPRERLDREAKSRRTAKGAVSLEDFMATAAAGT